MQEPTDASYRNRQPIDQLHQGGGARKAKTGLVSPRNTLSKLNFLVKRNPFQSEAFEEKKQQQLSASIPASPAKQISPYGVPASPVPPYSEKIAGPSKNLEIKSQGVLEGLPSVEPLSPPSKILQHPQQASSNGAEMLISPEKRRNASDTLI